MYKIMFRGENGVKVVTLAKSPVDTYREAKVVALAKVRKHLGRERVTLLPVCKGIYKVLLRGCVVGILTITKV